MTDTQQSQQPATSSHRQVLETAFSPTVVDAIDGRIKEVSLEALQQVRFELTELIAQHRRTLGEIREMPASPERTELAAQANQASEELRGAADQVNRQLADATDGRTVEPEEAERSVERTEQAREAVHEVRTAVDERVDRHEAILAVSHDGQRPPSRLDAIERDVASLKTWKRSADERIAGAQSTASRAIAIASASATSLNPLRRAASWALITFEAVFVLYLLFFGLLDDLDWTARDQFAWPFGLAAIAFWIGLITAKEASATAEAQAEAEVSHDEDHDRHDAGTRIFDREDHDHDETRDRRATADAHASVR